MNSTFRPEWCMAGNTWCSLLLVWPHLWGYRSQWRQP